MNDYLELELLSEGSTPLGCIWEEDTSLAQDRPRTRTPEPSSTTPTSISATTTTTTPEEEAAGLALLPAITYSPKASTSAKENTTMHLTTCSITLCGCKTKGGYTLPLVSGPIIPGLHISNVYAARQSSLLEAHNINAVVSLLTCTPEGESWTKPEFTNFVKHYLFVKGKDNHSTNLLEWMATVCDFIKAHLPSDETDTEALTAQDTSSGDPNQPETNHGNVLVHCRMGVSRSATMILAFLMREQHLDRKAAYAHLKKIWPRASPNWSFWQQLIVWEETGYEIWMEGEDGEQVPKMEYLQWLQEREKYLEEKDKDRYQKVEREEWDWAQGCKKLVDDRARERTAGMVFGAEISK